MKRTRYSHRIREKKQNRVLMIVLALVVIAGISVQIGMVCRMAGQNRRLVAVERTIRELRASEDNLNLSLSQYHNLERIAARAQQLGMGQPDETQLRVVNLPALIESTSAQSAENGNAEGIN